MGTSVEQAIDLDNRSASFLDDAVDPASLPDPVEEIAPVDPKAEPVADTRTAEERARDDKGRFAKGQRKETIAVKGGTAAPTDEPAAPAPAVEPVAAAPVVEAEKKDDLPAPEPFEFQAFGERVQIPGAQYIKGHGVFIPEGAVPEVRQAWARNLRHDHVVGLAETARQDAVKARSESATEKAQWGVVADRVTEDWLVSLGVDPQNASSAMRALALDVREAQIRAQSAAPSTPAAPPVSDGDLAQVFDTRLDALATVPALKDALSDPKIGNAIREELRVQRKLFEVPWDALSQGEQKTLEDRGFVPGVPVLDNQKLLTRANELAQRFSGFAKANSAADVATQVARRNAPVSSPSAAAPPPATGTPSAAAPAPSGSRSKTPSHFAGSTFDERRKNVKAFWDDLDAV